MIGRAAFCALLVCVTLAAPGRTWAGWLPPHTFTTTPEPRDQGADVAANGRGRALVAWHFSDRFSDSVYVAERSGGGLGDWQRSRQLSQPFANAHFPRVAIDDAGNAVVVWTLTYSEYDEVVQASMRLGSNGAWSPPTQISPPNEWSELGEIGFDNQGNLTAVWANITHHVVQSAVYSTITQTWTETQTISTGEMRSGPRLAVAPSGRAVVAWSTAVGNGNVILRAAIRASRTGAWLPQHDLSSPTGYAAVDDIAVDPSGQTIVAWDRFLATTDYLEVATLPAGSAEWSAPDRLNAPGTNGHNGNVVIDRQGNAFAAWIRDVNLEHVGIDVAFRPFDGSSWSPAEGIAEHAEGPSLTLDAAGDAIVFYAEIAWYATIRARVRNAVTGTWGPPSNLSPKFEDAFPLFGSPDPSRGAIALWQLYSDECKCFAIQGADYLMGRPGGWLSRGRARATTRGPRARPAHPS